MRSGASGLHIRVQLALKKLPNENRPAFVPDRDDIADQHLLKSCGELGCEIAYLIGVREEDVIRLNLADQLFKRRRKSVRRIDVQQFVIDRVNLVEFLRRKLRGKSATSLPWHGGRGRLAELGRELLSSGQRFKRHAVPDAAA